MVTPYAGRIRLTTVAAGAITDTDYATVEARAAELDATVGATWSSRHGWCVGAADAQHRVSLRGKGPLYAVLCGALDDLEAAA